MSNELSSVEFKFKFYVIFESTRSVIIEKIQAVEEHGQLLLVDFEKCQNDLVGRFVKEGVDRDSFLMFEDESMSKPIKHSEDLLRVVQGLKNSNGVLKLYVSLKRYPNYLVEEKNSAAPALAENQDSVKNKREISSDVEQYLLYIQLLTKQKEELEQKLAEVEKGNSAIPKDPDTPLIEERFSMFADKLGKFVESIQNSIGEKKADGFDKVIEKISSIHDSLQAELAKLSQGSIGAIGSFANQLISAMKENSSAISTMSSALVKMSSDMKNLSDQMTTLRAEMIQMHGNTDDAVSNFEKRMNQKFSELQSAYECNLNAKMQEFEKAINSKLESAKVVKEKPSNLKSNINNNEDKSSDEEEFELIPHNEPSIEISDLKKSLTESQVLYSRQVSEIESLGYTENRELTLLLLKNHNGDVRKVVTELAKLRSQFSK